jgi:hypothetical protein
MTIARTYYTSLVGRWAGRFDLRVTSWAEGGGSIKAMGTMARLVGGLWMETSLEPDGDAFVHTTRVSKAGLVVLTTVERITLGDDGRSLEMNGEQKMRIGGAVPYESTGTIAEDARGAHYRIPWAGTTMDQRTTITADGDLLLTQETPWSLGRVLLQRVSGDA